MRYSIEINYNIDTATPEEKEKYGAIADKYHALRIGHDNRGTSSIEFFGKKNLENILRDLESAGFKILGQYKVVNPRKKK